MNAAATAVPAPTLHRTIDVDSLEIFGPAGAEAFKRAPRDAGLHRLDSGHFALEEEGDFIAGRIREFLGRTLG